MRDFIEYVVAELKSKRLSKADAALLIKQFRHGSAASCPPVHPLLHRNTSDVLEQRYSSTFTGEEFFLADHQVTVNGGAAHKVLPGVAYLEMARAAVEHALPAPPGSTLVELQGTVWARPVIVARRADVSIALWQASDDQVEFEIYTRDGAEEIVHCQGRAMWSRPVALERLDLDRLEQEIASERVEPASIYDACARMGVLYGPALRGIAAIRRGNGQVLAHVRMPAAAADTAGSYVLHPSVMDAGLQAAVALIDEPSETGRPRLPFALNTLRVISPCCRDMVAWVRYSGDRQTTGAVVTLDIDLCDEHGNVCVQMHGVSSRLLREIGIVERNTVAISPEASGSDAPAAVAGEGTSDALATTVEDYLRRQLAEVLRLPAQKIDARAAMEMYGIDSILAMQLTNRLEQTFGPLSKTLFFEYQTLRDLAGYFMASHSARLTELLPGPTGDHAALATVQAKDTAAPEPAPRRRGRRRRSAAPGARAAGEAIAIIGLSGRYPEAANIDVFWRNVREGRDCITEVPKDRWDWRQYFSEDRSQAGRHASKWGGFIAGVDEFDSLFFNISPADAERIDPQERLFLQHAWMAVEDAGYTRASLQMPCADDLSGQVGVYVGVMYSEYQLFGAEASARGRRLALAGSFASISNRVSYVLDLHGPSMTVDTMCSSSLSAIHLACQDLKLGRTSMAIAGGVNVSIHPNKYLLLSDGQFISSDGRCQSFGEGGDGYIPGEGVGVVVLKRLSEAMRDRDHIYGIIRGSSLSHGGKTNGYTVPNPHAQTSVIGRALAEAGIDARHVSYLEAHGTGTTLGDPIEIAALSKAFRRYTPDRGFCAIGSVKSNIGHCEGAAGIAGLTKVLLQMQHREIVPSLHAERLNPHIDFPSSPFLVCQSLKAWEPPVVDGRTVPRIAGVSSFGAGGANAHLIVEEHQPSPEPPATASTVAIVLSARSADRLRQRARDLLDFVRSHQDTIDLVAMAYTLQVGREAMEERVGFLVSSVALLADRLGAYLDGEPSIEGAFQGQTNHGNDAVSLFNTDSDLQRTIGQWLAQKKLSRLLDLWVKGVELDWNRLYGQEMPARISLPAYPFAQERCWVDVDTGESVASNGDGTAILHPLLHRNTSELSEQRYSSRFTGHEFFFADHEVAIDGDVGRRVLPAVAYLEMTRAAIEHAVPGSPSGMMLELRNTVWVQPIVASGDVRVSIGLGAQGTDQIDYEIYTEQAEQETVHCQGCAILTPRSIPAPLDLEQLRRQMTDGPLEPARVYEACKGIGLVHGPSLRAITAIHRGGDQALTYLRLPDVVESTAGDYALHPSLLDGALQSAVAMIDGHEPLARPRLPFALESLRLVAACAREMVAWVRRSPASRPGDRVLELDIDLCDERGNVCVQMRGLAARELRTVPAANERSAAIGTVTAAPVWQAGDLGAPAATSVEYAERHVIVCELPNVAASALSAVVPQDKLLLLQAAEESNIAQRYSEYALACFEQIKTLLQKRLPGRVLLQVIVPADRERAAFAGLSGLLKTAALENPRFAGQLILVPAAMTTETLAALLEDEAARTLGTAVRYRNGERQVLEWQERPDTADTPRVAFNDDGVYLITGGLGGLGVVFATEIIRQTRNARVVLTGRSAMTPEKRARLDGLAARNSDRVSYRQVDLANLDDVTRVIDAVTNEYGRLDGILHSAGMIADNFIIRKTADEFARVLAPKVAGTFNLDQATRHCDLDFFVLFSSVAAAMGNVGQADYAAGNGFLDHFAAYRNGLVDSGERRGRTRSIDWPLWDAGGMRLDPATQKSLEQATGMRPMRTATGVQALYRSLSSSDDQMLVAEGDVARMRLLFLDRAGTRSGSAVSQSTAASDASRLVVRTQDYLRTQLSTLLKLPASRIDPHAPLEKYGIDSILTLKWTNHLEKTFGSLSKTLFFEYQTLAGVAGYLVGTRSAIVRTALASDDARDRPLSDDTIEAIRREAPAVRRTRRRSSSGNPDRDVAIVGLAGRYPQADDLPRFWRNLQSGRDCITEVPAERWDHAVYYNEDRTTPGTSYSKWGGFLTDIDKFDPLFFNISPREAALIDPQERLFLETVWHAIEDAGYTKARLSGARVGVFVGVMWGHYELFGVESMLAGNAAVPSSSHASIANRVSYFFDFHGPSLAVDTMCSSSLTAIHLACEELRKGEADAAIAGGVNLSLHPYKYVSLSQGRFAATDGRCRSFGDGGDGYVPGEGVGAMLLKPLDAAVRDGDQIYAVIKSTTVNHGGKTNGYTVPNPNAQAELILGALRKAAIEPGTLGYLEAHGTGTSLGDPVEIAGLSKAFAASTRKQFCPIGSVKSNIGHLESAAGIAAVTKVLLQLKYGQLVPSLHADPPNRHIDFADSPFYVQRELSEWRRPAAYPRRAGVSSFGAGGANAHVIVEEYVDAREPGAASNSALPPQLFVLSARDEGSLCRYAERVIEYLENEPRPSLADAAYTSQIGRMPMPARLAAIATSLDDLRDKLKGWLRLHGQRAGTGVDEEMDDVFSGHTQQSRHAVSDLIDGDVGKALAEGLLANRDLAKLAKLWVVGGEVDWAAMYGDAARRRVSLPTYPFARERHWLPQTNRSSQTNRHVLATDSGELAVDPPTLLERTEAYLKRLVGEEIRLAPERIGSSDSFESFGIDSVVINRLNAGLESALGALPKTLFYEYETIAGLSKFLVKEVGEPLAALLGTSGIPAEQIAASLPGAGEPSARSVRVPRARDAHPSEPIAIIGMHGYYPHAASLEDYWEYLAQGRDVIDVVPRDRWNHDELFDPDPAAAANGKAYCKWGGFLDDYDKFDPRFFDLSPEEARAIDPQERLFLQSVWSAIEDAGYTRANLKTRFAKGRGADVGVFVGVTTNSYHLWAPEERSRGNIVSPATMPWSIANRVSYFFDFHGPSLPVDTACSSSLVALHLACESLRRRECQVAVAGGVNLYLHPSKYQSLCQARMLAHDGKCHSYGAGTGFVPGEAIGSVVVKPLRQALEDRDRIHAVVLASASDHGGRSNGYSAPNPNSQSALISRALEQAGIHPESIGYVEGHGTGTALGDGVEVVALTQAFRRQTTRKAFCPIGSVKANIGHAESAAGMASLAKVILQLQHRQVVPSIHCDEANPNIDFAESPFYLQRELCDWTPSAHPPRALINSFGAGGVSACVVVEGHAQQDPLTETAAGPYVIPLSARSEDRLHESVSRLLAHLHRSPHVDLAGLSYTLQAGREAMEERLALVVSNVRELIGRLHEWKRGEPAAGVHRGSVAARGSGPRPAINTLTEIDHDRAEELASMWVAGGAVDWGSLYSSTRPRPITLPTYPFARERYWISDARPPEPRTSPVTRLHPLISYNSSTLTEVSFSSSVSDTEFYAVDHTINGLKILPAAAFVEIACVAGTLACARRIHKIRDVVWARPVNLSAGAQTLRTVLKAIGGGAEYVTSSVGDDGEVVWHSEGKLIVGNGAAQVAETGRRVAIRALKAQGRCESGGDVYRTFSTYGINYGPSFRTIQEAYVGEAFVLSRLTLADCVTDEWDRYLLHPSMIDGALQTVAGLVRNAELATPCIPFALDELEIVGPVPQTCYAYAERIDSERQQSAGIWRFNVQLLNESGDVLVRLTHLHVRPLGAAPATRPVAAAEADGRLLSLAGEGVG